MKNKSMLSRTVTVIIVGIICFLITIALTILAGFINAEIFDFTDLNFSNMIPVFLIGFFISCAVIGICVLFVLNSAFYKAKEYLEKEDSKKEDNIKKGENEK